jgi:fimbrial chaperone protein
MLRARLAALSSLAVLALWPGHAAGGNLEIAPMLVDLGRARSTLVSIRNLAKERGRYEVHVFSWDESPLGKVKLEPAKDLVAFPALLDLAPGEERKIRIGSTAAPGDLERSWRVFVEEILPATTAEEGARIRTRLRIGVPVFLAPQHPVAGGEIVGLGVESGKITFLLKNSGNVRLRGSSIRVVVSDRAGKPLLEKSYPEWYVLAGRDRLYEIDLPREACARAATVTAIAAGETPIEASQPVASGACAP